MRNLRIVLLSLLALATAVLAVAPSTGSQPQLAWAQTPRERAEGTLVLHQRVVVKDLSAAPTALAQAKERRVIPRLAPGLAKSYTPKAPKANAVDSAGGLEVQPLAAPDILTSFDGLDSTDHPFALTPPDPQIAVGPSHIVEFVNVVGRITDKSGAVVVPDFSLDSFFGIPPANLDFDP